MDRAGTAPVGSDAGDAERPLADQLVTLDLDDANAGEASRLERAPEIHDAIDLGSLSGGAAFPREGGVLAATIDEDVVLGPDEGLVALPDDAILELLHGGRALGSHLRIDLVGVRAGRCALLGRVREDAETVEADVGQELEEILERHFGLAGEADEHRRAYGETRNRRAKIADDVLHPPGRHRAPHGT